MESAAAIHLYARGKTRKQDDRNHRRRRKAGDKEERGGGGFLHHGIWETGTELRASNASGHSSYDFHVGAQEVVSAANKGGEMSWLMKRATFFASADKHYLDPFCLDCADSALFFVLCVLSLICALRCSAVVNRRLFCGPRVLFYIWNSPGFGSQTASGLIS